MRVITVGSLFITQKKFKYQEKACFSSIYSRYVMVKENYLSPLSKLEDVKFMIWFETGRNLIINSSSLNQTRIQSGVFIEWFGVLLF